MKLAVITDSSAYLTQDVLHHDDLFILEIPIYIDGESYVEGKNLTHDEFYQKMAASKELPKTSQPSVAELEEVLSGLNKDAQVIRMLSVFSCHLVSQVSTKISNI